MSLLDGGPQTLEVYVEVESEDAYGNTVMVPSDTPIEVSGRLQPSSAEESAALGQQTTTVYRFLSRTFPGGPFARVEFGGKSWDVLGDPKHHRGSELTEHFTTWLKER